MKKTVEVTIMGQKLQVRSSSDEEYIQQVAKHVDDKIKDILQQTKSVASLNVAILAAMNIADEHLRFREKKETQFHEMGRKVEDLIELIDVQL